MHSVISVITALISIEILLIFVRVLMSWFPGINPYNPLVRALRAVVDPVLNPFRRILPTFGGIDFSPILAILILTELSRVLTSIDVTGGVNAGFETAVVIRQLVLDIVIALCVIVLLRLLVSLFHADPFHPLVRIIRQLSAPLVRPFSSVLPRSRTFDSAAVVALAAYIASFFVARWVLDQLVIRTLS